MLHADIYKYRREERAGCDGLLLKIRFMTLSQGKKKRCDIRSECKAQVNRRYYERLLSKDWEYLVIKRDASTGKYKMERA